MVMKRRFKKRSFKKKKTFRRNRRSFRRAPGYDGGTSIKVHATQDINSLNALVSNAFFTVNWAGNGIAAGIGTTARLTVQNEFTVMANLYSQYRVIGCKVKIFPTVNQ